MTLVFSNPDRKWLYEVYGQSTYPLDFDLTNFGRIRLSGYTTFSQKLSVTYMLQLFIGPSVNDALRPAHYYKTQNGRGMRYSKLQPLQPCPRGMEGN
jgi:hypothetical protein